MTWVWRGCKGGKRHVADESEHPVTNVVVMLLHPPLTLCWDVDRPGAGVAVDEWEDIVGELLFYHTFDNVAKWCAQRVDETFSLHCCLVPTARVVHPSRHYW